MKNIDQASVDVANLIRTKKVTENNDEAFKLLRSALSAITTVF
jgi:hypothetical protein